MLAPGASTPALPPWVRHHVRAGHNLVAAIDESDAASGIGWAAGLIETGAAEEYALGAGFGMAPLAIRNPSVTNLIANALIFVVLLFSPIVFPPSNLPAWLFAVDRALPFYNMAEVIRAGLTTGLVTDLTRSYLVLLAWTAAGWIMTTWVVGRRH